MECLRKDLVFLQLEGSSEAEEGIDVPGNMEGCTPVEEPDLDVVGPGRWVGSDGVPVEVLCEIRRNSS
jgi:hypothetical protein